MHASVWRFRGDPDDLLRRYDAMVAEIPAASMRLHLCLRASDGMVLVDTCPSRAVFEEFELPRSGGAALLSASAGR